MIYANNINGTITRFSALPKDWDGEEGFQYSDKEKREANGFFELVIPKYDSETQQLGQIIGDTPLTHYTYEVINRDIEELLLENTAKRKEERNQKLKDGVVVQDIWFDEEKLTQFNGMALSVSLMGGTSMEWGKESGWGVIGVPEEAFSIVQEATNYFSQIYKDYA